VHLRRREEAFDVDAVESRMTPGVPGASRAAGAKEQVVVDGRAAARFDALEAREELVRIVAPRRVGGDRSENSNSIASSSSAMPEANECAPASAALSGAPAC